MTAGEELQHWSDTSGDSASIKKKLSEVRVRQGVNIQTESSCWCRLTLLLFSLYTLLSGFDNWTIPSPKILISSWSIHWQIIVYHMWQVTSLLCWRSGHRCTIILLLWHYCQSKQFYIYLNLKSIENQMCLSMLFRPFETTVTQCPFSSISRVFNNFTQSLSADGVWPVVILIYFCEHWGVHQYSTPRACFWIIVVLLKDGEIWCWLYNYCISVSNASHTE